MFFLYELFLFIGWLVYAPKLLWQKWRKKRGPKFLERLGFPLPSNINQKPVFWIHAVSLGEMKASRPLCAKIKQTYPNSFLFLTTSTFTGKNEAESILDADLVRYFPIDFFLIQYVWARRLKPRALLLMEGDIWINQLKATHLFGCKNMLVSGKLSERSYRRILKFPKAAKYLYSNIDLFLVQNFEHFQRFQILLKDKPLQITGNIKLAQPLQAAPIFQINTKLPIVVLSCTHFPEEEELLPKLLSLPIFLVLAPRHPERFEDVAKWLNLEKISFARFTEIEKYKEDKKLLLLDAMGKLSSVYKAARLAILGGSFSSKIGGHNPLEPIFQGTPVFFGPFMHLQEELAKIAIEIKGAKQVDAAQLAQEIPAFLSQPPIDLGSSISQMGEDVLCNTWKQIQSILSKQ